MSDTVFFFGKIDRNKEGEIGSVVPAWAMESHIGELKRGIEQKEAALENHLVPEDSVATVRAEMKREEKKLKEIVDSRPSLTPQQVDRVAKEYKELSKSIGDSLFSRSEMLQGTASPHEEAKRMVTPCIKVDPELAEACGVKLDEEGKVSRNGAARIFKIIGKYLGEESNIETLRHDRRK